MKYVLSCSIAAPRSILEWVHEIILSILFGSLLGDLYGERLKSGGVRFKQSIKHFFYMKFY
jgi:hypothetical protein